MDKAVVLDKCDQDKVVVREEDDQDGVDVRTRATRTTSSLSCPWGWRTM